VPPLVEHTLRALVTGAAGLVGAHLLKALCHDGNRVTALSRRQALTGDLIESCIHLSFISGDIQDRDLLRSVLESQPFDVVFHLAAQNASADVLDIYRVNVLGTATLLNTARELKRRDLKIIIMGSSAEYGASTDDPIHEDSALLPLTHYGASKTCADRMGRILFVETGQNVICARPFNILGPGQRAPLLPAIVAAQLVDIERGKRPPILELGDLSSYRDYVDARDIAEGLLSLARNGTSGEAYNLCSGRATQAKFVVEYLIGLTDIPVTIQTVSHKQPDINVPYQRGSAEKAKRLTGWSPKISLEQSLADALAHWRTQPVEDNSAARPTNTDATQGHRKQ
jgi:GDP-4-dehydro-6-deoxy-D-mannose reductase